jgi:hypothetical protein
MICRRSFEIDMAAFVHDARGPEWAEFRDHYPLCPDCNVEVRTWTELEIALQGGTPPASAHPTPEDLLHLCDDAPQIDAAYRRIVENHLTSCRPCADEIAALRAFDFEALGCRPGAVAMPAWTLPVDDVPTEPFANGATPVLEDPLVEEKVELEPEPAAPEPIELVAAEAVEEEGEPEEDELEEPEPLADEPRDAEPFVPALAAAEVGEVERTEPETIVFLAPSRSPGIAARIGRLLLHPAFGAFTIAALVAPIVWQGKLPDFPFGRAAPVEIYREVRVSRGVRHQPAVAVASQDAAAVETKPAEEPIGRVAVATVGDPLAPAEPAARPEELALETEQAAAPETESEAAPEVASEPAPEVEPEAVPEIEPDGVEFAAVQPSIDDEVVSDVAATAVPGEGPATRLDVARPVVVSADTLDDDLLLEIPVPSEVPNRSVLQVTIHGADEREIVERLPLTDSRAVTVRVAAPWLVPGDYRVELGIVKRGPAPVRVADYALSVR